MPALPSLLLALVLVAIFAPLQGNRCAGVDVSWRCRTGVRLPAAVLVEVPRLCDCPPAWRGAMRQMLVNIFPNCLAPLIVQASLGF